MRLDSSGQVVMVSVAGLWDQTSCITAEKLGGRGIFPAHGPRDKIRDKTGHLGGRDHEMEWTGPRIAPRNCPAAPALAIPAIGQRLPTPGATVAGGG